MHINEVLDKFWQEHARAAITVSGFKMRKIVATEKHPIYGWKTESQWYYKMFRQERELYNNEF